jgi:hypothetical protein
VGGAVADDRVADADVVRVVVEAAEGAARHVEALEDVVVRQTELDRVRPARKHRALPVHAQAADRDLVRRRARPREDDVAGVSGISINLDEVS